MPEKQGLTVTEIAKSMSVSRPTIYALMNRPDHPLPSIRLGRRRIIPRQAFLDWLDAETERGGFTS